jgi:hypothetical protein
LTRLSAHASVKAEVVKLRFFAGLNHAARSLGLSLATTDLHGPSARLRPNAKLTDAGHPEEL